MEKTGSAGRSQRMEAEPKSGSVKTAEKNCTEPKGQTKGSKTEVKTGSKGRSAEVSEPKSSRR